MKHFAVRGDVYSFVGSPTIVHIAACDECAAKVWAKGWLEFTTAQRRDEWGIAHELDYPTHQVAVSTQVYA